MAQAGVAGGQIGGEDAKEALLADQPGAAAPVADDQKQTTQANDQQFTEEQSTTVQAMIETAVTAAVGELKTEYEGPGGHLANVRSQLMTQANEAENEFDAERADFEQTIHQLSVKDMDENARAGFERDLYRERAVGLAGQLEDSRGALAASQQMGTYIRGLVQGFDVDINELNLDSVEDLSETAFTAAATAHQKTVQQLADATEKLEALQDKADVTPSEAEKADGKAVLPEAPAVTTQVGGAAVKATTLLDLRKSLSQGMDSLISEETLFDLAENPEETGVDLNIVLEALAAELETYEEAE